MKTALYCVGKMKGPLRDAAADYEKRFRGLTVTEFKEERLAQNPNPAQSQKALDAEAERILAKIPAAAQVVLLDRKGDQPTSEQLARRVQNWQAQGPLVFVIGSSHGIGGALYARADALLSFSKLTFPHQLMRVVFLEQLYRAQSIQDGQPYHK